MKNRPFLYIGLLGLVLVLNAYWLEKTYPSTAPYMLQGFSKPITFFEFIESPFEVESFFGVDNYDFDTDVFIKKMDRGNKIDFLFATLYSLFFFLFFSTLARVSKQKWYKIGLILAILAFLGDTIANLQLLQITSKITQGGYESNLQILSIFTWLKWISLACGFALFGLWLVKLPGVLLYMGYVAWIPVILGFFAFINRGIYNELFTRSINVMFFVSISYCFMFKSIMIENNNPIAKP